MRTWLTERFGIEVPVAGFSHCRDVVAAITNAGGLGVLGAVLFTPEQLDVELRWLDEQTRGRPYGVDLLVPAKLAATDQNPDVLASQIPAEHRQFVQGLLRAYGVLGPDDEYRIEPARPNMAPDMVEASLRVVFSHPVALVANALGPPPPIMIEMAKERGVCVAALVGTTRHAMKQKDAGVDLIVAQGYEAGGHTGEIATMVLTPEVVEAVHPTPVLAAGGIATGRQLAASLALGAVGAWTGSVWLTTDESDADPVVKQKLLRARSSDTVRSRARTGKPARQLRTPWHTAWDRPDAPDPLPMPLQGMLVLPAMRRISAAAQQGNSGAQDLDSYFVGQIVGSMRDQRPVKSVMYDFMRGLADSATELQSLLEI